MDSFQNLILNKFDAQYNICKNKCYGIHVLYSAKPTADLMVYYLATKMNCNESKDDNSFFFRVLIVSNFPNYHAHSSKTRCNFITLLELCPLKFLFFCFLSCAFKYNNTPQYLEYCHMDMEKTFLLVPMMPMISVY